ncbi:MAG: penicillin-binding protein 2, partial [Proteobacteria bacterium]|nr:penicillin-binding protein 2 [Pseudomonadota bacterium]
MNHESGRYKTFSRRSFLLAGGQGLLLTGLAARLYYLQIVEADRYRTLADENRISLRLLAPPRGLILDRHGNRIADNSQNYRVLVIPEQTKGPGDRVTESVARTLDDLGRLIPLDDFDRQRILREIGRKREFVPVTVAENLTWEEFSRLNVHSPDLPGVVPDVGETRRYPMGSAVSHVVGYVAPVSEDDGGDDPLLDLPGFRVGRAGIEREADLALRGTAGASHVEVNAHGRVIRELERKEGQPGQDIVLSIDAELQEFAARRLDGESAGAVVLDIRTGDVLAMTSTPSFEPDAFSFGMSQNDWDALVTNPRKPLLNKAVSGQYPPGSTYKMIVALAALEAGVAHPGHRVYCNGETELGDRKFHCWKREGHGDMAMAQALEQSCDVYFYDLALRTGIDKISEMSRRFGLGTVQDLGLGVERPGLIPTRDWKLARIGEPWQAGETLITGIGQGFVLTTPLQLAVMTAMIANGGLHVAPRLVLPPAEAQAAADVGGDVDPA